MKAKKYSIIIAILSVFIVYLDIILKFVLINLNLKDASGDLWWFLILIIACALNWLNASFYGINKKLATINLIWNLIPSVIFIVYIITSNNSVDFPYRPTSIIYMASQILLLIPIYILYFKLLFNKVGLRTTTK